MKGSLNVVKVGGIQVDILISVSLLIKCMEGVRNWCYGDIKAHYSSLNCIVCFVHHDLDIHPIIFR